MSNAFPPRPATGTGTPPAFAIVASQFNNGYVEPLIENARRELAELEPGARIEIFRPPGSFEIPLLVQAAAETGRFRAVLALGVLFQGETAHARLIADSVTTALLDISLKHRIPVLHEVLLVENEEQARARCLGVEHNRGVEAARAAVQTARQLLEIA